MSRATRIGSALAGLVVAAGMMVGAPAAQAEEVGVVVQDNDFAPADQEAFTGDTVWFVLSENAQSTHTVTSVEPGLFDYTFDPATPRAQQIRKITFGSASDYHYFCKIHGADIMSGVIRVSEAGSTTTTEPTTTTTTAPTTTTTAPTTTTTPPTSATTTPTTRPAVTTTTTRPSTTTAPTAATTVTTAKPTVSGASEPTTTTTKRKSTTTTKKKSTPSTKPVVEETTTTVSLLPSLAAAAPPPGAPEVSEPQDQLPDATESGEEAASSVGREKGGKGGGGTKKLLFGLGGLGALGLAGAGWGWYHRSSRYLPA